MLRGCFQNNDLNSKGRYTIGITVGESVVSRGPWIKFKFEANGSEYFSEQRSLKYRPTINGGKYYVKYLPSNPEINEIYWDRPVPETTKDAPSEGWIEIPN
jgi:hypothetical protein